MQLTHAKYIDIGDEIEKRNLFKTIMCSLCKITSFSVKTTWLWLPVLVGIVMLTITYWLKLWETPLAENNADEDKYKLTCCLVALAHSYQNREIIDFGIDQMATAARQDSWQMRLTLLRLMQRVLFRNLFLNRIHSSRIERIVIQLLEDPRLEVRECAGRTLSGLFRCHILTPSIEKRHYFYDMYRAQANDEIKRHAAVLGLEALINSAPYEWVKFWTFHTLQKLQHSTMVALHNWATLHCCVNLEELRIKSVGPKGTARV